MLPGCLAFSKALFFLWIGILPPVNLRLCLVSLPIPIFYLYYQIFIKFKDILIINLYSYHLNIHYIYYILYYYNHSFIQYYIFIIQIYLYMLYSQIKIL